MKKTAVEWLMEEMHKNVCWIPIHIQNQAKEMEKQQIMDAYRNGRCDQQSARKGNFYNRMAEQYYNETFKMK